MPLGRSWASLGCSLGASGTLLDVSWAPLGSVGHLLNAFLALGRVWGMVLEGFWKGLGLQNCRLLGRFRIGLWEGSNNFWGGIWKGFGISRLQFRSCLVFLWVSRSFGTPAMSRSAYTIRGGPPKRG